jgi:hypothetical protein
MTHDPRNLKPLNFSGFNPKLPAQTLEGSNLFLSVDSLEELRLLTSIRNELRSSPALKALLTAKVELTKD